MIRMFFMLVSLFISIVTSGCFGVYGQIAGAIAKSGLSVKDIMNVTRTVGSISDVVDTVKTVSGNIERQPQESSVQLTMDELDSNKAESLSKTGEEIQRETQNQHDLQSQN
ncbi:MAG: hypothetical protein ACK415_05855 [Thermodesulfovibrionales bacterium]